MADAAELVRGLVEMFEKNGDRWLRRSDHSGSSFDRAVAGTWHHASDFAQQVLEQIEAKDAASASSNESVTEGEP